ncbi:MAG: insulinase family protein [Mailhella sp.]|nr:insulinase family protein [Mailhella sp.]
MQRPDFTLIRDEYIPEISGNARLWVHKATGAQIISVCNADDNKCFGVTFRTPPKDSSGVAHILEHSVLCGSEKYPVKEPFVELLKSSQQTFLNAFTYPDKTCYPVASANLRDFYNLIDVYLDAVFHPRIDEQVFAQEGRHIHVDADGVWSWRGVVFNEMKGVYSSPDSVLAEASQQALFPDTLYGLDSGGEPFSIIGLSYEDFRLFHAHYYHPANARFFFWGDDPEEARLEKLSGVLSSFSQGAVDSAIPLQPAWEEPRKKEVRFAAEDPDDKACHMTVNWLVGEPADAEERLIIAMLEQILIGLPGSPLRKALMDSGLGEDIAGCGMETELRQCYFSVGLRSIEADNAGQAERLILNELARLSDDGVPSEAVESALSSLEFSLRENNTGMFPRGLSAMLRSLTTWLYDRDPFEPLKWEAPLAAVKARIAAGEHIFENAIRRYFVCNQHRVRVTVLPDAGLADEREKAERDGLNRLFEGMSAADRQNVADLSAELTAAQQKPDSPEALALIPVLKVCDLPRVAQPLPCRVFEDVVYHEIDTTGILYARVLFPLDTLPPRLYPLLGLFCRALTEMGTKAKTFAQFGFEISAKTGGLGASTLISTPYGADRDTLWLKVSGKAVKDKIPDLASLMREMLVETDFSDKERFVQMVLEEKARAEQELVPSGHVVVMGELDGMLTSGGALAARCGGLENLRYVRELSGRVVTEYESVVADLEEIRFHAVRAGGHKLSFTGQGDVLKAAGCICDMVRCLPKREARSVVFKPDLKPADTALLIPAQVNYVGLGCNMHEAGYAFNGAALAVTHFLRMGYLWDNIRVQGGAYGAMLRYSRRTGALVLASYRDPNVASTYDVYADMPARLAEHALSDTELEKAVLGAIGALDAYLLPSAKGSAAFLNHINNYTEEMRRKTREEVFAADRESFREFARCLDSAIRSGVKVALGGRAVEEYASDKRWRTERLL